MTCFSPGGSVNKMPGCQVSRPFLAWQWKLIDKDSHPCWFEPAQGHKESCSCSFTPPYTFHRGCRNIYSITTVLEINFFYGEQVLAT